MGRKSLAKKRIASRDPTLPVAKKMGKLSPKEAGIHRRIGRERSIKNKTYRPKRDRAFIHGERRYLVRDRYGRIKDNQSARLADSLDRRPYNQRTRSDKK